MLEAAASRSSPSQSTALQLISKNYSESSSNKPADTEELFPFYNKPGLSLLEFSSTFLKSFFGVIISFITWLVNRASKNDNIGDSRGREVRRKSSL